MPYQNKTFERAADLYYISFAYYEQQNPLDEGIHD